MKELSTPSSSDERDVPPAAHTLRVLIVDPDRATREGCAAIMRRDGHTVVAETCTDGVRQLASRIEFDLVLLDLAARTIPPLEVLRALHEEHPDMLVAVFANDASVESNVLALQAGAWEYVLKPFSATHLRVLVASAAHVIGHRRAAGPAGNGPGARLGLAGSSPTFQRVLTLARKVATTDASVMIVGESGTGKEMIARYVHAHSRRAGQTLVPVNCAALPEPLLESEMFGHRRGAFTGADRDKPGLLETASGGTLFLDELTDMSLAIQAKLLRVLQDGRIRRVGGEQEVEVDVRIVSATNRDPQQAVRDGILREDLFYRLWVFPIQLPPLRERPDDVLELAEHFLALYWARHRPASATPPGLSDDARAELLRRSWPGNVRELQNAMERLAVTADPGAVIRSTDVAGAHELAIVHDAAEAVSPLDAPFHQAKESCLATFERDYLARLVERSGLNMAKAARLAGIDRTTLYRMLDRHGLNRGDLERRIG